MSSLTGSFMETADSLEHYGVKGMKWGVRKEYRKIRNKPLETVKLTTEKGVEVTLRESRPGRLAATIGVMHPTARKFFNESRSFKIDVDGKNVGKTRFREKSPEELNFAWIGVNPKERGKGYASTVFDAGVEYAREKGYKKITLEVPGNAPDARHIYEKRGFKATGIVHGDPETDPVWGGLHEMEYTIPEKKRR